MKGRLMVELVLPVRLLVKADDENARNIVEITAVEGVDCPSISCVRNSMSEENVARLNAAWEKACTELSLALEESRRFT